jgi:hypothetical protein
VPGSQQIADHRTMTIMGVGVPSCAKSAFTLPFIHDLRRLVPTTSHRAPTGRPPRRKTILGGVRFRS